MNPYENENHLKKKVQKENKIISKNISIFSLKLIHKIFDSINLSLLILLFILSFLSFNSQRKWTNIYKNLAKTRYYNNNLIDYISKTEEFYINEFESLNTIKKTTPNDLIYLIKQYPRKKKDYFQKIKIIQNGLEDSRYQRGY